MNTLVLICPYCLGCIQKCSTVHEHWPVRMGPDPGIHSRSSLPSAHALYVHLTPAVSKVLMIIWAPSQGSILLLVECFHWEFEESESLQETSFLIYFVFCYSEMFGSYFHLTGTLTKVMFSERLQGWLFAKFSCT